MLIILSGLPGTGKSTLAQKLAVRLGAVWLRIDTIEQALLNSKPDLKGRLDAMGYEAAAALAQDQLNLGFTVILDAVNPVEESRKLFRQAAINAGKPFFQAQILCSDKKEHRRRVQERRSDIKGLVLPTWEEVEQRQYDPWPFPVFQVDTSLLSPDEAAQALIERLHAVFSQTLETKQA